MILTFAILMIVVFILEMAAGIAGYVLRNDTGVLVSQELHGTMKQYVAQEKDIIYIWDHVQRGVSHSNHDLTKYVFTDSLSSTFFQFECCGVDSYQDWEAVTPEAQIPVSCCAEIPGTIGQFNCSSTTESLFERGCAESFGDYIRAHAVSLGAAGIAICIIQFVGIFFACFLARQIKNKQGTSGF